MLWKRVYAVLPVSITVGSVAAAESTSEAIQHAASIKDALVEFFKGLISLFWEALANYIVYPVLSVIKGLFGGIGEGLQQFGRALLGGAGDAMRTSYETMNNAIASMAGGILAPVAPIISITVISAVIYIALKFAWDYIGDIFNPIEDWGAALSKLVPEEIKDARDKIRKRLR